MSELAFVDAMEEQYDNEPKEPTESRDEQKEAPASVTIDFPNITSMEWQIRRRWTNYILAAINEKLADGGICSIVNTPILTTEITKEECEFTNFSFWRVNQTDMLADIDVQVSLMVAGTNGDYTSTFSLFVTLWFNADEGFTPELEEIGSIADKPNRDLWPLDHFLIPYISKKEVEEASEMVWLAWLAEALKDANLRTPKQLAEKMGLSIRELKLPKTIEQKYILFFDGGNISVVVGNEPGSRKMVLLRNEEIAPNTIVINSNADLWDEGEIEIYQACFQYEWYYLFYALNGFASTATSEIGTRQVTLEEGRSLSDPVRIMGFMIEKGALGLMMPYSIMKQKVFREYRKACVPKYVMGYLNHEGMRMDHVIKAIANDFNLRVFRVRQRIIQMGDIEAKGAVNYDPDAKQYFPPYGFDRERITTGEDFYVTRRQLYNVYSCDEAFREMMRRGEYAFVDGLVCANDTEFVTRKNDRFILSVTANERVDRCCLRITKDYVEGRRICSFDMEKHRTGYTEVFDRLSEETRRERATYQKKVLKALPASFGDALTYLMKKNIHGKVDSAKLAQRAGISKELITRYCTDPKAIYTLDDLVKICVALNLYPWLSDALLDKAEMNVPRVGPLNYYGFILDCLYMEPVKNVKMFMEANGFKVVQSL